MNVDQIIEDAVKRHNLANPDVIIRKTQNDSLTMYFIYCERFSVWDSGECILFLYLKEKLSEERIYPFIGLDKINGEDKIGIFIGVLSVL